MTNRKRLAGVKEIAFVVEKTLGRPFSPSAVTRATAPRRSEPLPVQYERGGYVYAWEDEVVAWASRPGERRRPRRRARR
jgi:hypothetical protein